MSPRAARRFPRAIGLASGGFPCDAGAMFARAFLAAALLAATAFSAETFPVRLSRPVKAGDRFEVSAKVALEDGVVTKFDGEEVESNKTVAACRLSGLLTIGEVTKSGMPVEVRLKIKTVDCVVEGRPASFFGTGDELFLRRKDPDNEAKVNGEPADEVQGQMIESLLAVQAEGEVGDEEVFGTTEEKAVGAGWPMDAAAAVRAMEQNGLSGVKAKDVKGEAKLVGVGEFEGEKSLSIRIAATVQGRGVQLSNLPENVKGRRFFSEIATEMDLPVDVASTAGRVKTLAKMELDARGTEELNGNTIDVSISIKRRMASELTAKPAKNP